MNELIRDNTLRSLTLQRNIFLAVLFLLLGLAILLSSLLFQKSERVIIMPPFIEKEFWVEGANVSPSYLEQMGCFIGDLLLTRAPATADMQLTILMRHTAPSFAHVLSQKLSEEVAKLKKDNASYVFFRSKIFVNPQDKTITIDGDRNLIVGDKVLSKLSERYRLGFENLGGRLLLSSIERVEAK